MGVTSVAACNAGDGKGKGQGNVDWIAIGSEADLPARENVHVLESGISARTPCPVNPLGSLANIDVATAPATVPIAPVHTVAADEAVKTCPDRFRGGNRTNEYPNLDHVAGLSIVGGSLKARCDDHAVLIFVENESVAHRLPPWITVKRTLWPVVSFRPLE